VICLGAEYGPQREGYELRVLSRAECWRIVDRGTRRASFVGSQPCRSFRFLCMLSTGASKALNARRRCEDHRKRRFRATLPQPIILPCAFHGRGELLDGRPLRARICQRAYRPIVRLA